MCEKRVYLGDYHEIVKYFVKISRLFQNKCYFCASYSRLVCDIARVMKHLSPCIARSKNLLFPTVLILMMVMGGLLCLQSCHRCSTVGHGDEVRYAQLDSLIGHVTSADSLAMMMKHYHSEKDIMGEMLASKYYGREMRKRSRLADAIAAHNRSLALATEAEDTIEMVEALNDLGTDCRRQGDLAIANDHLIRALKLTDAYSKHESEEALSMRVTTLNGIGMIEIDMCNYPIADSVFHEALEGEIKLGRDVGKAVNYSRLGAVKQAYGQLDSAWYYYRKSLECNQLADNKIGVALCHLHFGELHEDERRFSHAIDEYRVAYDQLKDLDERWYWLESCLALARVSIKMGEKEEAQEYLQQAEAEALHIGSREHQARGHLTRYELARLEGNPQEALEHYVKGTELLDSVYGLKKNDEMRSQFVDYERTRASGQVDLLNKDITHLKRMRNMQTLFILALLLMGGAIIAALVYAMRVRSRTQRLMRQVEETRSLFFTNVVHLLRTPLTAIMGAADNIVSHTDDVPPEQQKYAEVINRQGRNLLLLVDRILEVGSVRSEVNHLEWRRGDVVAFMRMILEKYRERCVERHIELIYAPLEDSVEIDTVPNYLSTIMGSLVDNCLNYCREFCKITVTSRVDGGMFIIRVADDGMGISKSDLPHVFEPFYRSTEAERLVEGMGIGLTVVRDMVMAMGGTVAVDSMKDHGAVFTIELPCKHDQDVKERFDTVVDTAVKFVQGARRNEIPDVLEEGGGKGKPVVLVVEDHNDVAHLVGSVLKDDYDVQYAYDGEQGLARALELKPSVLITDVKMPQMDGCEMCRRIRANSQLCDIPILMLSARTSSVDRIKGINAGADVYLVKPFVAQELLAWVDHLVVRGQLKRAPESANVSIAPVMSDDVSLDDRSFLYRFAQLVDEQFACGETKPDLDKIALAFKMGESQLKQRIQTLTGKNVTAFISQLRMEKAMRLLKKYPDMLIGDVAEQCGFVDVAYFSRVFRRYYGMTPTQARSGE